MSLKFFYHCESSEIVSSPVKGEECSDRLYVVLFRDSLDSSSDLRTTPYRGKYTPFSGTVAYRI